MSNSAISATAQQSNQRPAPADVNIETYKKQCDWFVAASTADGQSRVCTKEDFKERLRQDILAGRLKANSAVYVYAKKGAAWDESTPSLRTFAQKHYKLQALYEPVWALATNGRAWGMLVGMGLAILNSILLYGTANRYGMTNHLVAIGLAAALLVFFIPGVGPKIAPYPFAFAMVMGGLGCAFGILAGLTVLATLGAVSGMAIGGLIGWTWEDKLPRAPDAPAPAHGAFQSVVLPFVGALLLWSAYLFVFYPWAAHMAGVPLTAWGSSQH